jgi:phage baseplate assembly protein W
MKSIKTPFQVDGGSIAFITSQSAAAEQKITDVLVTMPAERVGFDDYGVGLEGFLFDNISDLAESDVQVDVAQELNARITGVTILDVVFEPDEHDVSTVRVNVRYALPLGTAQELSFKVVSGFLTEESPL